MSDVILQKSRRLRYACSGAGVVLLCVFSFAGGGCSYSKAIKAESEDRKRELRVDVVEEKQKSESPVLKGTTSLGRCLELALEQNHKRPASRFAVAMAEAQHKQALSAYWPHLTLSGKANLRSDDPNYIFPEQNLYLPETALTVPEQTMTFPASSFAYPGQTLQTPATQVAIPANAFGPGFPPAAIQVPVASQSVNVPGGTIAIPEQSFTVPEQEFVVPAQNFHLDEQEIKTIDKVTYSGQLDVKWLLLDGGGRKATRQQARLGVAAAEEDARRTDLEMVYDVKRMCYGSILAKQLEALGADSLEKIEATLELTEQLFEGGSMKVNKTDYLRNNVLVEGLRGMVEKLKQNRQLAEAALGQAMGLSWRSEMRPRDSKLKFEPSDFDIEALVSDLYAFSPDWRQLEIGIDAAEAQVRKEKSGLYPMVAFIGNLHAVETDHDIGYATDSNLNAWNAGIGVEMPLWDGLLIYQRIEEAKGEDRSDRWS